MSEPYRVPKHVVPGEVGLVGHPPLRLSLFLSERAETHGGRERPSDLLNGSDPFFAAQDVATGEVVFIQRFLVTTMSVAVEREFEGEVPRPEELASELTAHVEVEAVLQDGSRPRGRLTYLMPEGKQRLQDYLNTPDNHITLVEGGTAHLINKHRIVQIRVIRST